MPIKGTRPPASRRRAARVGQGRRRARDDRRPRAQRPLARLRAGHDPLAAVDGDAPARRRRAHRLDRRGDAARGTSGSPSCSRRRFPGGSVTGAPKIAAVDHIAALEPVGRGASMGALGRVRGNGDLELALTIRTFAIAAGRIHLWVGGGIVWDSDPAGEVEESLAKARPLLDAIGAPLPDARPRCAVSTLAAGGGAVAGSSIPPEPVFAADDEGFLRGRAAFETLRVYDGRPFRLAQHLDRLARSAASARPARRPTATSSTRLADARARAGACARLRCCGSTGRPGRPERTSRWRSRSFAVLPPDRATARARPAARLAPRRPLGRPWLLAGSSRRATRCNSRRRPRHSGAAPTTPCSSTRDGIVLEGPVTNVWWRRGHDARHAVARPRHPRRRNAGRPARARAGARLRVEEGAYPLDELLGADEAFTSSSVREVLPVVARRRPRARTRARPPTSSRPRSDACDRAGVPRRYPESMEKLRLGGMALAERRARARPDGLGLRRARCRTARCSVRRAPKPRFAPGVQTPFLRGPLRLAEAFALLPEVRRALPEARFAVRAAAGARRGRDRLDDRRASPPLDALDRRARAVVALASLVPAALALRGGELAGYHGAEHVSIGSYEHDGPAAKEHDRCGSHLVGPLLVTSASAAATPRAKARPRSTGAARLAGALGAVGASVEVFGWMEPQPAAPARAGALPARTRAAAPSFDRGSLGRAARGRRGCACCLPRAGGQA